MISSSLPIMADQANPLNRKDLFLRSCRSEPVERVPVWIMRQAGRYLPEYRAVRQKRGFLEICKTPELAVEVSLQPFRILDVDAVIVFSDILIPAEAMGIGVELNDGGPAIANPIRERAQIQALREFDPEEETAFLPDTIRELCRQVGPEVPVLGFAAAPWTLACYMVEGHTASGFTAIKQMMYEQPALVHSLLEKIARTTAAYLRAQLAAGAAAVQLFDTWAGELSSRDYGEFGLPATQLLIAELNAGAAPVILYSKASGHLVGGLAEAGADVLSVDWRTDLAEIRHSLGGNVALQGNVDPCVLLGPTEGIGRAVHQAVEKTGGIGHILNLGHGILPSTPVENAQAFVRAGKTSLVSARIRVGGTR